MRNLDREIKAARSQGSKTTMTPTESVRLRETIEARLKEKRQRIWQTGGAAICTFTAISFFLWTENPKVQEPEPWFSVTGGTMCVSPGEQAIDVRAGCEDPTQIVIGAAMIDLAPNSTALRIERRGHHRLRIRIGRARFVIEKQKPDRPYQIEVSHGRILVLGTRFQVFQGRNGGRLELEEGVVEFRSNDGRSVLLENRGTLTWPLAPVAVKEADLSKEPATVPLTPAAKKKKETPPSKAAKTTSSTVKSVMIRQFRLRAQRRYADAIRVLRQAAQNGEFSSNQRERFAVELGTLLENLGKKSDLCRHDRWYLKNFPIGKIRRQTKIRLKDCAE